jgi:hypothetical protein
MVRLRQRLCAARYFVDIAWVPTVGLSFCFFSTDFFGAVHDFDAGLFGRQSASRLTGGNWTRVQYPTPNSRWS